jgi:hypothetical protein
LGRGHIGRISNDSSGQEPWPHSQPQCRVRPSETSGLRGRSTRRVMQKKKQKALSSVLAHEGAIRRGDTVTLCLTAHYAHVVTPQLASFTICVERKDKSKQKAHGKVVRDVGVCVRVRVPTTRNARHLPSLTHRLAAPPTFVRRMAHCCVDCQPRARELMS